MLGPDRRDEQDDKEDLKRSDLQLTSLYSMPATGSQGGTPPLNINHYATKKSAAESMLDLALFLANVTHMKTVIEQGAGFRYYIAVLTLISFSLALQIIAGVLFIIMARRNLNNPADHLRLHKLSNVSTGLVTAIIILNLFISSFGMQRTGYFPWLLPRIH